MQHTVPTFLFFSRGIIRNTEFFNRFSGFVFISFLILLSWTKTDRQTDIIPCTYLIKDEISHFLYLSFTGRWGLSLFLGLSSYLRQNTVFLHYYDKWHERTRRLHANCPLFCPTLTTTGISQDVLKVIYIKCDVIFFCGRDSVPCGHTDGRT